MDRAGITRSINTIRAELEYLRDTGIVSPPQFQSIMAQLPQQGGAPSQYVDSHYAGGQPVQFNPSVIAQQAQDPNHPANPKHSHHGAWAKSLGSRLGSAAIFGGGATIGADLVNSII